ncbi:CpsD/CapB family tyrosine-protein kinase [Lactiplantibacillus plantarum]|uniref:non-specific protein-tyrosine kinase n=1 Tax=Lactiplantibacillus plantarum (strain ATCC BAA-793 / NCIMB 8826 / WCFS1) TaxID=220668 RepID=F9UQ54_LACPL|nr:CpsD/CapB family tyrosine-protein kinase [Lactiplantibacillus plantarum]ASX21900.1 exopolysaccharide biosynthesis protein [Lactiplantibacillus plantarum]MDE4413956.1 exopolysaccharide biosynthesis protein [Lactiplantibacillus plantarum]MDE4416892.1 exopolysaccharide biosynthesis protein [Lactiplantibacillus plantarum]MDE4420698.1 exopolysaccharide biosynthesis protein [Lactiplantibacillus plantarum]MDE4422600.1 exopolysaccharide biosynthesis protein [Lactiplantibacillus plantarum]
MKLRRRVANMHTGIQLTTLTAPMSVVTEQVKTIRTNLNYAMVGKPLKTLMITSAIQGEGKSTVSSNLAVEYAKKGLQVLLVDADLRRPTIHQTFAISNQRGVSSWLSGQLTDVNEAIYPVLDHLFVMPSGPKPPNPAELLASDRMSEFLTVATRKLDLVIVDAPPILPVTDARILAGQVDGTVLVVRQNFVEKVAVRQAVSALKNARAQLLGTILNDVDIKTHGYGYGYYGTETN